ncbi:hypothetical protein [Kitasatospora sp. NPDC059327]|uniref:hypothetical protein n=1 Tax=Kitasatospora sp. NPDC059327 TaxID=3346803 RepID=UPI0036818971
MLTLGFLSQKTVARLYCAISDTGLGQRVGGVEALLLGVMQMQGSRTNATGFVSVERSQFGLWEDDPFGEADVQWLDLPLPEAVPGVALGAGAIKVRSSVREHYAKVTVERASEAVCPEGFASLAQVPYRSRSGRVEVWTLFSGPTGVTLEIGGEGEEYILHVFWASDPSKFENQAAPGVTRGAEEFHFVFVAAVA